MKGKRLAWFKVQLCLAIIISLVLFWHLPAVLSTASIKPRATSTPTEIRGVWLTNVASGLLFAPWGVNRAIALLSDFHFNTVYPVVWNRGHTFYPSEVAKQATGRAQEPVLQLMRGGTDVLAEIVKLGHQKDLSVIPWFEYGFIAPANSALAQRHPDWLTQSREGTKILISNQLEQDLPDPPASGPSNPLARLLQSAQPKGVKEQVWLNPFHPEVQQFIKALILEVVNRYDVDGIQLDDHFGLPVELGYDPYTVKLYQKEHQGKKPPHNPSDPEWMRWRADKLTNFMAQIARDVRTAKSNLKVSLSPNSWRFSYRNYLQDWQGWVERGLVDELVLQVYRDDLSSFLAELAQPSVKAVRRRIPVSVGILAGTLHHPVKVAQIQEQVQAVRDRGFAGVSFFYWESLWSYLTPESPQKRRREFQSLFPAPAIRPQPVQPKARGQK